MGDKKLKLLYLAKYLEEETDQEHPAGMPELLAYLTANGISAERKSVYDDLRLLESFGMDIETVKGRQFGYYLGERTFQLPEVKLLVDAVQAAPFLTQKKSMELIGKLEQLTSRPMARQLRRQVYVLGRPRTTNDTLNNAVAGLHPAIPEAADYVVQGVAELVQNYAVDGIHTAISRDRQVSFRYFDWTAEGQRAFRRDGAAYVTDPVALCVDRYYYLVAYDALRQDYRHYRVDRMADLTVLDSPRSPLPRDFDLCRYVRKIFDMYGGASVTVRLRLHRSLINPAMDRFGSDAHIRPDGPDHVSLTAPVEAGPTFYGWLFQFGDKAELLSPADVRRDFADYCRRVLPRYDALNTGAPYNTPGGAAMQRPLGFVIMGERIRQTDSRTDPGW